MQRAFTLVEMSIVLAILGLLVGGIMGGQSLIRGGEIRAVIAEYNRYSAAFNAFQEKYDATAGDMNSATTFWGDQGSGTGACADAAVADGTPGTCNGNGDGIVNKATAVSTTGEVFRAWQQLTLAGLTEGSYTGYAGTGTIAGPIGGWHAIIGTNVPASRYPSAGWGILSGIDSGSSSQFSKNYGNTLVFGATTAGYQPTTGVLLPENAWNIDTKLDDGKPGLGDIISSANAACSTATSSSDYNAVYVLSSTAVACPLYFLNSL